MRRANRGAYASLLLLAGAGLLGVVAAEPVAYPRTEGRTEVLGSVQERSAVATPSSADFLADPESLGRVPVEPSDVASPPGTAASSTTSTSSAAVVAEPGSSPSAPVAPSVVAAADEGPPAGEQSLDQLRDAVVASLGYPVSDRLPEWRIEFVPEREGYRGSTFPGERLVQVYVRPDDSFDGLRHVAAHEIGHAVDVTFMSPTERADFNQARGRAPDATWWVQSGGDDFASGSGDWAECFAAVFAGPYGFQSRLGGLPDAAQAELIRRLARG